MDNFQVEDKYVLIFEADRVGMQNTRHAHDVKPE